MQLDDLTEERSIASIQNKTNLAADVITNLFNKNFKALRKSQAIGAISIIEREFSINLDVLKEECKAYYAQESGEDLGVTVVKPIAEEKSFLPKIMALLVIALVAYGAWYFYTEYYQKQLTLDNQESVTSLSTTIIQDGDTNPELAKKKIVDETQESPKDASVASEIVNNNEINSSEASQDLEQNDTSKASLNIENTSQLSVIEELDAPKTETNSSDETNISAESLLTSDNSNQENVATATRTLIKLVPDENMWFRLINLKNKKRREFKRDTEYYIDMRENDWLFAAQNVSFSFVDGNISQTYGGRGKLFYKLDQSGIHDITQDEFRALEK